MRFLARLRKIFGTEPVKPLSEWFTVSFNDETVTLNVNPPGKTPLCDEFKWKDVIRVCFKAEGLHLSDGIYVFTSKRPENYVIPTEAKGGCELWGEIVGRGLFDADLAVKAAAASEGLF